MTTQTQTLALPDPPWVSALFHNTRWAWIWLPVRLYAAYLWLTAVSFKFLTPDWMNGEMLKAFWQNAVAVPQPPAQPEIAFGWYRAFIQMLLDSGSYVWFSKLVAAGELSVGLALLLGAFTGIAALVGAFMVWNFMMAGSAGLAPFLLLLCILLVLAWRVAGWWGLDRWLLPLFGMPWYPGRVFRRSKEVGAVGS